MQRVNGKNCAGKYVNTSISCVNRMHVTSARVDGWHPLNVIFNFRKNKFLIVHFDWSCAGKCGCRICKWVTTSLDTQTHAESALNACAHVNDLRDIASRHKNIIFCRTALCVFFFSRSIVQRWTFYDAINRNSVGTVLTLFSTTIAFILFLFAFMARSKTTHEQATHCAASNAYTQNEQTSMKSY